MKYSIFIMFSYKKTVESTFARFTPSLEVRQPLNSSWLSLEKTISKYSPLNISTIEFKSPAKKFESKLSFHSKAKSSFPSLKSKVFSPLKKKTRSTTLMPLKTFELVIDSKTKKPSIINTIKQYKQEIERKYLKIFQSISDINKPIQLSHILNFIRIKKYNKDLQLMPWQNEMDFNNSESLLARVILELFDLNNDGTIELEEFYAVCSVHNVYFSNIPFNFFNFSLLLKLRNKVYMLKKNFSRYTKIELMNIESFLKIISIASISSERKSFIGFISNNRFDFKMYLKALPVFLKLETYS
jgi:hypothetical protein